MSNLYIIATPIGNLEDITLRALRILKEVDFVLCEDTRVTKKLLSKYEIETPTISYHTFSGKYKTNKILDLLSQGKNLALVSDAGTPTISDPGFLLITEVKEKLKDNVNVIPVPGPSALITALSGSGLSADQFLFLGFLPHKKGRQTLLMEAINSERTVVFYESPHRVLKTLELLKDLLNEVEGSDKKKIVVAKELTKIYEEIVSGNISEVMDYFSNNLSKVKGEFVFVIQGK
ncbi:MAG: 16S rRNA (cytidine(1402)-2'-O)-methyltransferase [Patescibacteria group bacterium]|nr:16S rRNA (cytidine(1402)-2'-O)-methyltransferase [Patescibacteria group bacterium]